MPENERPAITLTGEDRRVVHAAWSRSGRTLILTVARDASLSDHEQVLLSPADAQELSRFLAAGPG